jgi:hypothetical protein
MAFAALTGHLAVIEATRIASEDVLAVAPVVGLVEGEREMTQPDDGQKQEGHHEERGDQARVAAEGCRGGGDSIRHPGHE